MRLFGKKPKTVDFTKLPDSRIKHRSDLKISGDCVDLRNSDVRESKDRVKESNIGSAAGSVMDFLGSSSVSSSEKITNNFQSYSNNDFNANPNELIELKRMIRATSGRVEDNSNEVYRLIQRIELLERKMDRFEGR